MPNHITNIIEIKGKSSVGKKWERDDCSFLCFSNEIALSQNTLAV